VTNVPPSRPVEAGALDDAHKRLAATFDRAGELYQRARPEYPDELYDRLLQITQLSPGARLLEVGCATGKATLPLAHRGFRITCVEPGPTLAAAARANLAGFHVDVVETSLEDWTPAGEAFAMVFAATAWHWVDPTVRYRKAADALAPGGYLALWGAGHVIPRDGDPFFEELQEVYDEIGESLPPGTALPRPQELADDRAEIEASGLFDVTDITQYDWETVYDAEGYRPAEHVLGPHRDAGLATRPSVQRDPPTARDENKRPLATALGQRPPHRPTPHGLTSAPTKPRRLRAPTGVRDTARARGGRLPR
jgi:SAM-dependent methyltransferase